MGEFSNQTRNAYLHRLEEEEFDMAIIGGGITGAGTARDAASRGLRVALIEAQDFAIGTSSRSSKLIHGGIRYLEQREFGLVFEALSERQHLFEIAPHLVHPLRFVIPLYKTGRVGMTLMGLGMWLYDVLSLWEAPELHAKLGAEELKAQFPFLNDRDLLGGYVYSDAYMDDDRLVFETLRSAADFGACAVNFVKAADAEFTDGKMSAIIAEDVRKQRRFKIRARHFVSTVGPWTDRLAENFLKPWKKILRPSKGVHLIFSSDRLPLKEAIVMAAEKRIVFGIPRHDMVIVGTTDTDFDEDPYQVRVEASDVDYLLQVTNRYFPGAKLSKADVLSAYAGVRPLVADQSESESGTSREHLILEDPRNITFVAGGKYTTYRRMASQTVETVLRNWDMSERGHFSKSLTLAPLNPKVTPALLVAARSMAAEWAREFSVPLDSVHKLCEMHGVEAFDILSWHLSRVREVSTSPAEIFYGLEAQHAMHATMCLNLSDFIFRRSHLFLAEADHGRSKWEFLSRVMGQKLGWTEAERISQLNALQKQILLELKWRH